MNDGVVIFPTLWQLPIMHFRTNFIQFILLHPWLTHKDLLTRLLTGFILAFVNDYLYSLIKHSFRCCIIQLVCDIHMHFIRVHACTYINMCYHFNKLVYLHICTNTSPNNIYWWCTYINVTVSNFIIFFGWSFFLISKLIINQPTQKKN